MGTNRSAARRAARQEARHVREGDRRLRMLARLRARHGMASFVWERGRIVRELDGALTPLELAFPHHDMENGHMTLMVGLAAPEDFFEWAELVQQALVERGAVMATERMLVSCACEHIRSEWCDMLVEQLDYDDSEIRLEMLRLPEAWLVWAIAPTVAKSYGILG